MICPIIGNGKPSRIQATRRQPWVASGDYPDDWRRAQTEDRFELVTMGIAGADTANEMQRWAIGCAGKSE
jgi:hypothetical protein